MIDDGRLPGGTPYDHVIRYAKMAFDRTIVMTYEESLSATKIRMFGSYGFKIDRLVSDREVSSVVSLKSYFKEVFKIMSEELREHERQEFEHRETWGVDA